MSELIKIHCDNDRPTTSARSLWEFLDKPHGEFMKWFSRHIEYGFTESIDFRLIDKSVENSQTGRPATDYEITIDMAKELSMLQRSEKGKIARQHYIELEKSWNSPEMVMARSLQFAAKHLEGYKEKLQIAENIIEKQKPQVLFAKSVTASRTSILVADLARILNKNGIDIGEIRLWEWLRNNGYAIKERGRSQNMPTQRSMNLKVMDIKEGTRIDATGYSYITKTTLITGKGQIYFVNKFLDLKEDSLIGRTSS